MGDCIASTNSASEDWVDCSVNKVSVVESQNMYIEAIRIKLRYFTSIRTGFVIDMSDPLKAMYDPSAVGLVWDFAARVSVSDERTVIE